MNLSVNEIIDAINNAEDNVPTQIELTSETSTGQKIEIAANKDIILTGNKINRDSSYRDVILYVAEGGNLTLKNITIQ